jgi:hypothetical protein
MHAHWRTIMHDRQHVMHMTIGFHNESMNISALLGSIYSTEWPAVDHMLCVSMGVHCEHVKTFCVDIWILCSWRRAYNRRCDIRRLLMCFVHLEKLGGALPHQRRLAWHWDLHSPLKQAVSNGRLDLCISTMYDVASCGKWQRTPLHPHVIVFTNDTYKYQNRKYVSWC